MIEPRQACASPIKSSCQIKNISPYRWTQVFRQGVRSLAPNVRFAPSPPKPDYVSHRDPMGQFRQRSFALSYFPWHARYFFNIWRHRCGAMRISHPYGFKPQRAANPSGSSRNLRSRKSSVPCHVQLFCTKYMDSAIRKADPAFRRLMTWAPRRIQQSFRYL